MRYCCHCGHVIDEFDFYRKSFNCHICDAILIEDDMTALKYAQLSEEEKDKYDEELINTIKNSIGFDEILFNKYNSTSNGEFWVGFRLDKYAKYNSSEDVEFYSNFRKDNEPFKPFSPIDKEKARAYTYSTPVEQKQENNNVPKCPTCQSTNIRKMGGVERGASIWAFGLFSKKINKTFKCNSCGYTW